MKTFLIILVIALALCTVLVSCLKYSHSTRNDKLLNNIDWGAIPVIYCHEEHVFTNNDNKVVFTGEIIRERTDKQKQDPNQVWLVMNVHGELYRMSMAEALRCMRELEEEGCMEDVGDDW